ncbi:MAG: DNA methyltransferase [Planctomycetota bacterium]
MPTLASDLRNKLERVVIDARDVAEGGARAALETLAVHEPKFYPHMSKQQQELRNHLRARARQLGDRAIGDRMRKSSAEAEEPHPVPGSAPRRGAMDIAHLVQECAYEHWHRMLFARFLAENGLLIEPQENMAISLAEAEELAKEDGVDVWVFASRCAQRMLPAIFRPDDPLLQVSFATEHRIELERLLDSLPHAVFTASDALGWVYQFWQSKKKDEVNRSEVKIGADEISAVTQLFTEPYMVEFLLHNTLGAWWAGRKLSPKDAAAAKTEDELRVKLALPGVTWDYLRFVREENGDWLKRRAEPGHVPVPDSPEQKQYWRPAAGTFDGWPKTAAQLKVLDPCCGSGHFLVASLQHLVPIRMAEEGLTTAEAVDAVLRDNLHGLEIDERCCQIAAFALAFAAWTYPKAGGYRPLPDVHIACTGIGPQGTEEQWLNLAEQSGIPMRTGGREAIRNGLLNLHRLFSQAPTLGSLIDPANLPSDMYMAGYDMIQPYLAAVLKAEKADDETHERAIAAAGMVKAADLLAGEYALVITNVPYLGRGKQDEVLKAYLEKHHSDGKRDLATAFVERCLQFNSSAGASALVTPQNWFFLPTYKYLRQNMLKRYEWNIVVRLGPGAFEGISGHVVNVGLPVLTAKKPVPGHRMVGIDASVVAQPSEKAAVLAGRAPDAISLVPQAEQLANPDATITLTQTKIKTRLGDFSHTYQGIGTADASTYVVRMWEVPSNQADPWAFYHMAPGHADGFSGCHSLLRWEDGQGKLARSPQARVCGQGAWGKDGVAIAVTAAIPRCAYVGSIFDCTLAALIPDTPSNLPAIYAFVTDGDFSAHVRGVDQALSVTESSFGKVPFDLAHWQKVAAKKYPDGLPEPESDDPTQWLFHGRPKESTAPLQVAVARLLGYRWPAELDDKMRLSKRARALVKQCDELAKFADKDGIVCIPSVRGEEPAAERLLHLLDACDLEPEGDLDDWLRNDFFQEHCELFHHRPFVWHIWDGRKRDGFHALVNYHKLCEGGGKGRKLLESLTYSYLGWWISRQRDEVKRGEGGAEDRLAAALELQKRLEAILEGEPPFDIFVRWKPLHEQPIGWEPDINDGVRMNIRPFLASDLPAGRKGAGVLRWKPKVKWDKDRGKEPERPKAEFPWFWAWDEKTEDFAGGKAFDGNRWNDCHYTNKAKQAARAARKGKP